MTSHGVSNAQQHNNVGDVASSRVHACSHARVRSCATACGAFARIEAYLFSGDDTGINCTWHGAGERCCLWSCIGIGGCNVLCCHRSSAAIALECCHKYYEDPLEPV